MSKKRDYTRYSKETVVETAKAVVEPVNVIEVSEPVVEDIPIEAAVVEVKQESKFEEVEPIIGIVTNCAKLNVREQSNSTAAILGVIPANTELVIIEEESTKDFYKICTPAGLEGYCMKKFITIIS